MFLYFRTHGAEVAQHGQRRRTEAPIPQGFVGSNPTLRTNGSLFFLCLEVFLTIYRQPLVWCVVFLVLEEESAALIHHLPADFKGDRSSAFAFATGRRLVEAEPTSRTEVYRRSCCSHNSSPYKKCKWLQAAAKPQLSVYK
jgi:hypothetical protein